MLMTRREYLLSLVKKVKYKPRKYVGCKVCDDPSCIGKDKGAIACQNLK